MRTETFTVRCAPLLGWRPCVLSLLFPVLACRAASKTEIVEIEKELGPGNLDLTNTRAGLAELSSYESVLTIAFEGSKAGQPVRWSNTHRLQVTKSPPARRLTVETVGAGAASQQTSLAERGGAAYEWKSEKQCSGTPPDLVRTRLEQLEPAALLSGVLGAEEAGTETLNGVAAKRYTFDERALGASGMNNSAGELWLAAEGGHLLRYRLATKGDSSYFGEGTQGTVTWDYQLTRINQPFTIELPATCPPGLVDAPMLPGASNVESDPGVLRYQAATVADAAAFYDNELGALGWKTPDRSDPIEAMAADPAVREALADPQLRKIMKNMGLESAMNALQGASAGKSADDRNEDEVYRIFEKGDQTLRVLITRGESGTEVVLLNSSGK